MGCLLISDDLERSAPVAKQLGRWLPVRSVALSDFSQRSEQGALFLLIDIDLSDRDTVQHFKSNYDIAASEKDKIFVTQSKLAAEIYQANALGALCTLPSDFVKSDVDHILQRYAAAPRASTWQGAPERTMRAIEAGRTLYDSFFRAAATNGPLPKEQIVRSCDEIAECLKEDSIGSWLEVVRRHDGYTYRHCMIVYGVAVAFALHLGMRRTDVQRIATGALLHDIGKVWIPLRILDKPARLSPDERVEINKHPGYGAEILRKDGQFDDEVVDIALHHHEMLDGSGYPEGLAGNQISDPVRIITIVDIFAALIDQRSYKEPLPNSEAYQVLVDMDGKLDKDILRVFYPVACAVQPKAQQTPAHSAAAAH